MKNLHVAVLATLFGTIAASGVAFADPGEHGRGHGNNGNHGGWQQNGQFGQNGAYQCNRNGNGTVWAPNQRDNDNDNDNDDDDNGTRQNQNQNQGNRGASHGRKNGWNNPRNPHYCGNANCQYNGQYGQYGQNGQYGRNDCAQNGQGNATVRGTITAVSGNQVTLVAGFGQSITINDQPALDNQTSGRVVIGRFVTAYGYWQNNVFYATSMQ